jgi:two-component system sensor histidine kinase/response regulator
VELLRVIEEVIPAASADNVAVLNPEALLAQVDGDRDLLRELVQLFGAERPRLQEEIRAALEQGQPVQVQKAAHTLKGAVSNFTAQAARELAQTLENMGHAGDLSGAGDVYQSLAQELAQVEAALRGFLEQPASPMTTAAPALVED